MCSEPLRDLGSSCPMSENKGEVISQPEEGCCGHLFFLSCLPPGCTCQGSSGMPESAVPAIMGVRFCAICPAFLTGLNMLAKHQDVFITSSLGLESWTLFKSRNDTHFAQVAFLWHPVALQSFRRERKITTKVVVSQISIRIQAAVKHPAEQRWPSEDTFSMQIKTEDSEGCGFQLEGGAAAGNVSFPSDNELN